MGSILWFYVIIGVSAITMALTVSSFFRISSNDECPFLVFMFIYIFALLYIWTTFENGFFIVCFGGFLIAIFPLAMSQYLTSIDDNELDLKNIFFFGTQIATSVIALINSTIDINGVVKYFQSGQIDVSLIYIMLGIEILGLLKTLKTSSEKAYQIFRSQFMSDNLKSLYSPISLFLILCATYFFLVDISPIFIIGVNLCIAAGAVGGSKDGDSRYILVALGNFLFQFVLFGIGLLTFSV